MLTAPLITTPGSTSPVADSCELAWRLLDENRDLIDSITFARLRSNGPRVVLHTRAADDALPDLAGWAARFGGTIVGSTSTDDAGAGAGAEWRSCRVAFEFLGERVEVWAYIPARTARSPMRSTFALEPLCPFRCEGRNFPDSPASSPGVPTADRVGGDESSGGES